MVSHVAYIVPLMLALYASVLHCFMSINIQVVFFSSIKMKFSYLSSAHKDFGIRSGTSVTTQFTVLPHRECTPRRTSSDRNAVEYNACHLNVPFRRDPGFVWSQGKVSGSIKVCRDTAQLRRASKRDVVIYSVLFDRIAEPMILSGHKPMAPTIS